MLLCQCSITSVLFHYLLKERPDLDYYNNIIIMYFFLVVAFIIHAIRLSVWVLTISHIPWCSYWYLNTRYGLNACRHYCTSWYQNIIFDTTLNAKFSPSMYPYACTSLVIITNPGLVHAKAMIVTLFSEVINVHEKYAAMYFSNVTKSNITSLIYVLYLSE